MATLAREDERALIAAAVARSLFTAAEGDEALRQARTSGRPVAEVLVERGLLAPRTIESLRTLRDDDAASARTVHTPPPAPGPASGGASPLGGRLGDYEVLEKLGEGGMGAVYRARQVTLDREVALKVVSPQVAADPEYAERFLREASAAAKVSHPNVITIFDAGRVDGRLLMALELMRGGDAAQLAKRAGGRLPEARALELVRDGARGLQALENAGLVHRDIKPANVFLGADGAAKLADLGLARARSGDDRVTNSGVVVGTPAFMAPEQADGSPDIDVRADVYALGATLFQLVTGAPPYTGSSPLVVVSKVLTAPVPDPRALRPDLSASTAEVIVRALAKDRAARFQSSAELLVALERARAALGGRAAPRRPEPAGRVIAPLHATARQERPGTVIAAAPAGRAGPGPLVAVGIAATLATFGVAAAALLLRDRNPPSPGVVSERDRQLARERAARYAQPRPAGEVAAPRAAPSSTPPVEPEAPSTPPAVEPASTAELPPPTRTVEPAASGSPLVKRVLELRSRSERDAPEVLDLEPGVVRVSGDRDWSRVSFVEGPLELPVDVVFECADVQVSRSALAEEPLVRQGFDQPAGFFYELGVRLGPDGANHVHAGVDLTDALWLSLTFAGDPRSAQALGLLRAVGPGRRAGDPLRLEPRASGLVALSALDHDRADRAPRFLLGLADGATIRFTLSLAAERVVCTVEQLDRSSGGSARPGPRRTFETTWSELGLTAPERVWAWAHVGNWARGRGEGRLKAWVER